MGFDLQWNSKDEDLAGSRYMLLNDPSDIFAKYRVDVFSVIVFFNKASGFRIPVSSCTSSNGSRKPVKTAYDIAHGLYGILQRGFRCVFHAICS